MNILKKLAPSGFLLKKMLKKAGKVGATTLVAASALSAQTSIIGLDSAFWIGLTASILSGAVNYLNQVSKSTPTS